MLVVPQMSGPEVLATLRQRDPGLKAVLGSGYADPAVIGTNALPLRTRFLAKPYTPASLRAMVRETLDT